jgi:hypothetical protein
VFLIVVAPMIAVFVYFVGGLLLVALQGLWRAVVAGGRAIPHLDWRAVVGFIGVVLFWVGVVALGVLGYRWLDNRVPGGPWQDGAKRAFLDSCNDSDVPGCSCILGKLQRQYPKWKDYTVAEDEFGREGLVGPFETALEQCLDGAGEGGGIP